MRGTVAGMTRDQAAASRPAPSRSTASLSGAAEADLASGCRHLRVLIPRCGGPSEHHAARDALRAAFFTAACTQEAARRARQFRQESMRAAAKRYGISPPTVQTWRDRKTTADAATGPKEPRSTVLTPEEEATEA